MVVKVVKVVNTNPRQVLLLYIFRGLDVPLPKLSILTILDANLATLRHPIWLAKNGKRMG
jgi:hypothetical protein